MKDILQLQITVLPQQPDPDEFSHWREYQPPHGWDNWIDVEYCRALCFNQYGAIVNYWDEENVVNLAREIRSHAVSEKVCLNLITKFNRPGPGMHLAEVANIVREVYRNWYFPPGVRSLLNRPDNWNWPEYPTCEQRWPIGLSYDPKEKNNAVLAEVFLHERADLGGGKMIYSDEEFYTLTENKIWRPMSEDALLAEIRKTDPGHDLDTPRIESMAKAVKLSRYTDAKPFAWIETPHNAPDPLDLILFRNGILNLATGELLPLTGQYFATGAADFDYDPEATCPLW
jgi:hypothetical protein